LIHGYTVIGHDGGGLGLKGGLEGDQVIMDKDSCGAKPPHNPSLN